jgi:hypothetical protein
MLQYKKCPGPNHMHKNNSRKFVVVLAISSLIFYIHEGVRDGRGRWHTGRKHRRIKTENLKARDNLEDQRVDGR